MRILVFGAGAIGSLFGAKLSKYNDVTLLGREDHVSVIRRRGLIVRGKTRGIFHVDAISKLDEYETEPDVIMLTVKSYDTEDALKDIIEHFGKDICVMSIQNGLDNLEKMERYLDRRKIIIGLTTEGCTFLKPGEVKHSGEGVTVIGSLDNLDLAKQICKEFNKAGIKAKLSNDIKMDMWKKAIVNACINPLTAVFGVKNGFLKDEVLFEMVKDICRECIEVSKSVGIKIEYDEMLKEIEKVIESTSENISSMLQSIIRKRRTEIDSINGYICDLGRKAGIETRINRILMGLVKIREGFT